MEIEGITKLSEMELVVIKGLLKQLTTKNEQPVVNQLPTKAAFAH